MKSEFQFSNPELAKIEFSSNSDFKNVGDKEVQMKLNLSVNVDQTEEIGNEAMVSLVARLGERSSEYPFYIEAVECAHFRWDADRYEKDMVKKLLNQNAPALLLSYLRPILLQITAASPYEAYHVPFINFTSE